MMLQGDLLKDLRKQKKLSQNEMANGLMSRQNLIKIEKNASHPDINTLVQLLEKVNYTLLDFARELQPDDPIAEHFELFTKYRVEGASLEQIKALLAFASKHKKETIRTLSLYGLVISYFHLQRPEDIPYFSTDDTQLFINHFSKMNNRHSFYDLKLVADFAFIEKYSNLKKLFWRMEPFNSYRYSESQYFYSAQVHKIYSNFADAALTNNDLEFAEELIFKHKEYLKLNRNMRVVYNLKTNEITLKYLQSKDLSDLEELKVISDSYKYFYDELAAKQVLEQYQHYLNLHHSLPPDPKNPDGLFFTTET